MPLQGFLQGYYRKEIPPLLGLVLNLLFITEP